MTCDQRIPRRKHGAKGQHGGDGQQGLSAQMGVEGNGQLSLVEVGGGGVVEVAVVHWVSGRERDLDRRLRLDSENRVVGQSLGLRR